MLKHFKTITPDDFFWNDLPEYFGGNFSAVIQIPNEASYYMLQPSVVNTAKVTSNEDLNLNENIADFNYKYGIKSEIIRSNLDNKKSVYIVAQRKPQQNIDLMLLTYDDGITYVN